MDSFFYNHFVWFCIARGISRLSWTLLGILLLYLSWIVDSDGAKGACKGHRPTIHTSTQFRTEDHSMLFCRISSSRKIDKSGAGGDT